jgi:D-glycero-D-manno-heptose 1,7-bisphosphate phosphatase
LRAAREHGIDLARSFIVGDHPSDVVTGQAQGVRGAYVLTGHGRKHREELPAGVPVFPGIAASADWIVAQL